MTTLAYFLFLDLIHINEINHDIHLANTLIFIKSTILILMVRLSFMKKTNTSNNKEMQNAYFIGAPSVVYSDMYLESG